MKIVYTTNGRDPGPKSKEYTVPLTFPANTTFKARSITAGGRMGDIRTIEIVRSDAYKPATATTGQGLEAAYYPGVANTVAELEGRSPEMTEHVETPQKSRFNLRSGRDVAPEDNYSTVITGHINIPDDGI